MDLELIEHSSGIDLDVYSHFRSDREQGWRVQLDEKSFEISPSQFKRDKRLRGYNGRSQFRARHLRIFTARNLYEVWNIRKYSKMFVIVRLNGRSNDRHI